MHARTSQVSPLVRIWRKILSPHLEKEECRLFRLSPSELINEQIFTTIILTKTQPRSVNKNQEQSELQRTLKVVCYVVVSKTKAKNSQRKYNDI